MNISQVSCFNLQVAQELPCCCGKPPRSNESTSVMLRAKTAVLAKLANTGASYNNNKTNRNSNSPCRRFVHVQKKPIFRHCMQVMVIIVQSVFEIWLTSHLSHIWKHIRANLPNTRIVLLLLLLLRLIRACVGMCYAGLQ